MQNRRDFLKTLSLATVGASVMGGGVLASCVNINRGGVGAKMKVRCFPYELQLRHVFTVATNSRTTTQGVQVEIEYDGIVGYGEASMPP